MSDVRVVFDVRNELGEGAVWLPEHQTLAWCDILGQTVNLGDPGTGAIETQRFDHLISAIFPAADGACILASELGLLRWVVGTANVSQLMAIESENELTRSNDGRVAPGGSIWLGTMGRKADAHAGCLYHIRGGQLEVLRAHQTIPNATCFSPAGDRAYYADTTEQRILTCAIDPLTGRPTSAWDLFVDLSSDGLNPDGAVVDADGCIWNAQWGAGRVARYTPSGQLDRVIEMPAKQVTCPAFGGSDFRTLFVTSAWEHMSPSEREKDPLAGAVFAVEVDVPGLPERHVVPWW